MSSYGKKLLDTTAAFITDTAVHPATSDERRRVQRLMRKRVYRLRVALRRLNRLRKASGLITPFRLLRLWLTRREMRAFTLFLVQQWAEAAQLASSTPDLV